MFFPSRTFKRLLVAIALVSSLSACVTPQGIRLARSGPSAEELADFNARNLPVGAWVEPGGQVETPATTLLQPVPGPRVIVVGHVMALQALDADDVDYQNYARAAAGPGQRPALDREAYVLTSAGRTAVRTAGVTGIYSQQNMAEVPRDLVDRIEFSSAFGTAMVGTYGDLVAMQVMPLLGPWLTHVLCRKREPDYAGCLERYATGVFQSSDGREIDGRLRVVEGGERIDTASFRRVLPRTDSDAMASAEQAMRFKVRVAEFIPIASSDSFIDGYGVVYGPHDALGHRAGGALRQENHHRAHHAAGRRVPLACGGRRSAGRSARRCSQVPPDDDPGVRGAPGERTALVAAGAHGSTPIHRS